MLGEVRLGEVRLGEVMLGEVMLGEVRLGEVMLGEVMLGEVRLGEVISTEGWTGCYGSSGLRLPECLGRLFCPRFLSANIQTT